MCVLPKISTKEREVDCEELDFGELTPAILAPPPPTVESKRTMIGHGWMEVAGEDLGVSSCSRYMSPVLNIDSASTAAKTVTPQIHSGRCWIMYIDSQQVVV